MKKNKTMKKLLLCLVLLLPVAGYTQSASCSDLVSYAKLEDSYPDKVLPMGSSMLAKVEYYRVNGGGLVIAYIKKNDYDYTGTPYIFCGISSQRWAKFKSEGMFGSWGEAFHNYIREYTCDCG